MRGLGLELFPKLEAPDSKLSAGAGKTGKAFRLRGLATHSRKSSERDENGLSIGTYSNFFDDPEQIKGTASFCAFLAAFFLEGCSLRNDAAVPLWRPPIRHSPSCYSL